MLQIDKPIYICSATRTPIGAFRGAISSIAAVELGAAAITEAQKRAGIGPKEVDECIMGCVLTGGLGQAPSRQAWLKSGGNAQTPCSTVGKVCGSGMHSVILASKSILLGETDIAVAGGMENMSATRYGVTKAKGGYPNGAPREALSDMMVTDGLWDVYNDMHMGLCCEKIAQEKGLSRKAQDDWAINSYTRALTAQQKNRFENEIVPILAPDTGQTLLSQDEGPLAFNEEKLRVLKPAFDKSNGTITAGNASTLSDGAAALVLASEKGAEKHGLNPIAKILSWGYSALEPLRFPLAPPIAAQNALAAAGLKTTDMDHFEINEAFAAVALFAIDQLGLNPDRVNTLGGAVALGHPLGASGARVISTLINVLKINQSKRGLATLCIGGGEGIALVIENI